MSSLSAIELLDELIQKIESIDANNEESKDDKEESNKQKPQVFFVLGGPGAGKGTQCTNLVSEFGLIHLSAGDLLRAERNSLSKDADLINNYIKEGKIVPVAITVGLIKKAMMQYMRYGKYKFVIDGFPRNFDNLKGWNDIMSGFADVPFLLLLECNEQEMTQRIMKRAQNAKVKRRDDNLETLPKRFNVFNKSTMPVIETFKTQKKLKTVVSIGAINDIYDSIRKHFVPYLSTPQIVFVIGDESETLKMQCKSIANDNAFHKSFVYVPSNALIKGQSDNTDLTVALLKQGITNQFRNGKSVFIIEGFPNSLSELEKFNQSMGSSYQVSFCLSLNRSNKCSEMMDAFSRENKLHKIAIINENELETIYKTQIRKLFVPFTRKPSVVFVLGGPGAGKGTQCSLLVKEFGIVHLSAGDLLRAERKSGSKHAELINNYIKEGKIVPVAITVGLIKKAMISFMRKNEKYVFVIDGFPRNYDNLEGWNRICGSTFANVPFLLHLKCSEQVMTDRILKRADGAKVVRKDDNIKTLKKRFKVFSESTMNIINVFSKQNNCVEINAMDDIEKVYKNVRDLFVKEFELK